MWQVLMSTLMIDIIMMVIITIIIFMIIADEWFITKSVMVRGNINDAIWCVVNIIAK
jgi:hypothetical protein